jgi:hypothetical protein
MIRITLALAAEHQLSVPAEVKVNGVFADHMVL